MLLGLGCVLGLALSQLLPLAPLHAVATDRQDMLALATGEVEPGVEAVFVLDFLSGDLRAGILNPETHTFTATYFRNIVADLKVETGKTPRYLIVTGGVYLRTKSNWRLAAVRGLRGRANLRQDGLLWLRLQFFVSEPALDVAPHGVAAHGRASHPHHDHSRSVAPCSRQMRSGALLLGSTCTTIQVASVCIDFRQCRMRPSASP